MNKHTTNPAVEIRDLVVEYPARLARTGKSADARDRSTTETTALLRIAPGTRVRARDRDHTAAQPVRALDGVSLHLAPGERVALVGESGSGKSTLGNAIGRLLPHTATYRAGSIRVDGVDVLSLDTHELRRLRREDLGFIPQDPIASLDPTMRVGRQFALVARAVGSPHDRRSLERMLEHVQIADPRRVLRAYPHELSGGMAQRVAIAIAMARKPKLLIADEPTAALDANVRRDVLQLIFAVAAENNTAILWISHNLESIGKLCDRVAVMHRGRIVEIAAAESVLTSPQHEYTKHLLESVPARLIEARERAS